MSRKLVADEKYALRRIPPWSSNWRPPPEARITSCNFKDHELSVDIFETIPSEEFVRGISRYATFLKDGMGFAFARVGSIRVEFKKPKDDGTPSVDGDVYHDPISDNSDHAIVTGKANNKKVNILSGLFGLNLIIKPGAFTSVYSSDHQILFVNGNHNPITRNLDGNETLLENTAPVSALLGWAKIQSFTQKNFVEQIVLKIADHLADHERAVRDIPAIQMYRVKH